MNILKYSLYNNNNNIKSILSINKLFNSNINGTTTYINSFFTKRESKKKLQKANIKRNTNDRAKGSKKQQDLKPQRKEHTLKKHRKINMELERIEKLTNGDGKEDSKKKYKKNSSNGSGSNRNSSKSSKNSTSNNTNQIITSKIKLPVLPITSTTTTSIIKSEEEIKRDKVKELIENDEAIPTDYNRVKYYVTKDMEGMRVDRWINHKLPILPHSLVCKWLRNKIIFKENGELKQGSENELKRHKIKFNDKVEVGSWIYFPSQALLDQHMADINEPTKYSRLSDDEIKEIKESVLYKDDYILVLNKPQGLSVQGGSGLKKHLDMMLSHLRFEKSENPKLVHRLDKATSGILILGRSRLAATAMTEKFELKLASSKKKEKEKYNNQNQNQNSKSNKSKSNKDEIEDDVDLENKGIKKTYWALIAGSPKPREGRIRAPLKKVMIGGEEKVIPALKIGDGAKLAITEYKVIQSSLDNQSFIALWPETGRTHQLRVHCASVLNAPIIGDTKYGNKLVNDSIKSFLSLNDNGSSNQNSSLKLHLHARRIEFLHPFTNKHIDIIAPLPQALRDSWKKFGFNHKIDDKSI